MHIILPISSHLLKPTVYVTASGISQPSNQPTNPPMTLKRLGTDAAGLNAAPNLAFAI